MGLDTTHDCWHGSYSSFSTWRAELAKLVNIELDAMEGFGGETSWLPHQDDPVCILLNHSDSDGSIAHVDCLPLANRLKELLPLFPEDSDRTWGNRWLTQRFIDGLMRAHAAGEDVEFR